MKHLVWIEHYVNFSLASYSERGVATLDFIPHNAAALNNYLHASAPYYHVNAWACMRGAERIFTVCGTGEKIAYTKGLVLYLPMLHTGCTIEVQLRNQDSLLIALLCQEAASVLVGFDADVTREFYKYQLRNNHETKKHSL